MDALPPQETDRHESLDALLRDCSERLRRALVGRYGLEVGLEATQDAVAYACANPEKVLAMDNPAGYLYRVGQSASRRYRRRGSALAGALRDQADTHDEPDLAVVSALDRLSPRQRTAVLLVVGYSYRYGEVATLLGISESSVRNHVRRGIQSLRRHLKD